MSILKSLKLTFPLLLSCTLLLSNGGTVFAEGSQNGDMEPTSEISSQSTSVIKMSLDPELNKKFAEQQGYGLIPLSEHPDFFTNSETYASSEYKLIQTITGGGTTTGAESYAVYKMYKSVTKGDDIITFEFQSNAKPKSGYSLVGFTESHWIGEPAYEVIDWSPKGTTKTTSGSTIKWEINPSYKGFSLGKLAGEFGGKNGSITGYADQLEFEASWNGTAIKNPDVVYLSGAIAWGQLYQPQETPIWYFQHTHYTK
ncbi:hypothetical protein NYE69_00965 [Paenibacillus sp. FSL R5-0527]|uniref:Uncharacterized protein n=1 Tax=Paenibacillus macerans TaxID=44252 RepID=A0A090YQC6_PAEMA|nr:hypothetical protein [Paenibacillus macerans]KFM94335.1 hypothetical protein DJ90_1477 [Paenibacillus macerans]MCY7561270.1 hypothetical protein [Paenibacillus macerans]MEC0149850.1 hypothetical protein [Paenibacillus macerans]MED4957098.1 hypothetical protein [Paenibacillus macerans]OMG49328.1 hypothetical protein BK140_12315 [Paenibacillus macerans]